MFIRLILPALAALFALAVALWVIGMTRAQRETADIIEQRVVLPTRTTTIDLSPAVYAGLPPPVQRYFEFAFNGRESVTVDWVDWAESGDFLLPVGQFRSRGRQVSRAAEPVYTWTGTFAKMGLPMIESRDGFFLESHDMRAKLFGWLTVMHTDYSEPADRASLHSYLVLRYYGQAPLMPWALLPNKHVRWVANDEQTAHLEVTRDGLAARYLVTFAPEGHIVSMETDRLLMEGNGMMQREFGLKLDYREVNGFQVPARMDYRWTAADGSLVSHYAFDVQDIRYRHP